MNNCKSPILEILAEVKARYKTEAKIEVDAENFKEVNLYLKTYPPPTDKN
jgi:hypothetical protein